MKGVVQQKGNLYLVCPKIMLPPINRDTPQNMPVLNGGISAGYLYFSLKSEENGISRLSLPKNEVLRFAMRTFLARKNAQKGRSSQE